MDCTHSNSRFVYLLKLTNYSNRQVKSVVAQDRLISNVNTTSPSVGFYHAKQQLSSNHPSVTRYFYFAIVFSIRLSDNNNNDNNLRSQVCLRLSTFVSSLLREQQINQDKTSSISRTIFSSDYHPHGNVLHPLTYSATSKTSSVFYR